jgi:hypothetical protein
MASVVGGVLGQPKQAGPAQNVHQEILGVSGEFL